MKTTRTNCFETNSSSTHSMTIHAPTNLTQELTQTFLKPKDGALKLYISDYGDADSSLLEKAGFLVSFAYHAGDQEGFDRVVKTIEDFTQIPVQVLNNRYDNGKKVWDVVTAVAPLKAEEEEERQEELEELMSDTFYSYCSEYGNGSASDFISQARAAIASTQSILVFIFSNHTAFSKEAHYDG